MRWLLLLGSMTMFALLGGQNAEAQPVLNCSCLATQAVLFTNACCGSIPNLCSVASNCYSSTVVPPPGFTCTQNPAPGTPVCSTTPITFTLIENLTGNSVTCKVNYNVGVSTNVFTAICPPTQFLPCNATGFGFTPPGWTNTCCTNGIVTNLVSVVTNWPTVTVNWSLIDGCGVASTCSQSIAFGSSSGPCACVGITCPADIILQTCLPPFRSAAAFTNVSYPLPSVTNYCIGTITNVVCVPPSGTPFPVGTNTVGCTAYDSLGNSATCAFNIVVLGDTTPPVINCPAAQTNFCGSAWAPVLPTAFDACCGTNVTITLLGAATNTFLGCMDRVTFKWLATDCNGNHAQCNSQVYLVDNVAPVITCRSSYTLKCGMPLIPPVATDNCCPNPTVNMLNVITNGAVPCNYTLTITWQAQDCCTNTATCTEVVTLIDLAPPVLTCASNKTIECGTPWTFDAPGVFDDCCGTNVTLTVQSTFTNVLSPCLTVVTRNWLATDCCTNSITCSQIVSITDTTPPALTCASNKTIECGTPWVFDPPVAFDICCGTNITISLIGSNLLSGPCPRIWRGIWQATDCCSNLTTCTQLVTIVDTIPPVVTCASNKTVQCGTGWVFDAPTGFDICAGTNLTYQLLAPVLVSAMQCQKVWHGPWQASDGCNVTICTQVVTEVDTIAPVITCTNKVVPCGSSWTFNPPSASDLCCTNLTYQLLSSNLVSSSTCLTLWAGGWRVTDCCGNSSVCTQHVSVVDNQPPTIACPSNYSVGPGMPWSFGQPTASDACCGTNVTITTLLTHTNSGPCATVYKRFWRATDCCGKSALCFQQITATNNPPANDLCPNAIPIILNAPYICGNTVCATPSAPGGISPVPCGNSASSGDVWYSVIAQCTGPMLVDTCPPCPGFPTFDTVLSAYSGACNALTQVSPTACNDNACGLRSAIAINTIAGQAYWFRVAGAANAFGYFSIRAQQASTPPPNDLCTNAIPVVPGVQACGSTICATPSGGSIPPPCGNSINTPDVWYTYTPQCGGQVTINTCGPCANCPLCVVQPQYNTVLSVYTGQCAAMNTVACNDDAVAGPCAGSPQSQLTFTGVSGVKYYIRVSGAGPGTVGFFRLNLSFVPGPPPPNDFCANATPVTPGVYPWNNCYATTDGPLSNNCPPGLNLGIDGYAHQDVWFKYTAPCAGPASVSACDGGLGFTFMNVYSGTCANLNLVGCAFWGGYCSSANAVLFNAVAGTTYYIRLGAILTGLPPATAGMFTLIGPNPPLPTCPPPGACTWRYFRVIGSPNCINWSWALSAPCCMNLRNTNVAGVCAGDENTLAASFVNSINAAAAGCGGPIATAFPSLLNPGRFGICTTCVGSNAFTLLVGGPGDPLGAMCAVPNPGGYVGIPVSWCSFNPDIQELRLSGQDLNHNGVDDAFDIDLGTSQDLNVDGIPDEAESCLPTVMVAQPQSLTAQPGEPASLVVTVSGTGPFTYQWLLNGQPVSDGLGISGSTTATLSIGGVTAAQAGDYSVMISNDCGVAVTMPATVSLAAQVPPVLYEMSLEQGWFRMTLETRNGFEYVVEYKNELTDEWATLQILQGSGEAQFIVDTEPPSATRFYRVLEHPHAVQ